MRGTMETRPERMQPACRQKLAAARFLAALVTAACLATQASLADCVVVFNEIMYHPAGPDAATQEAREWIELRNQMAVDVDVSRWSLTGGVAYTFPANTILPG